MPQLAGLLQCAICQMLTSICLFKEDKTTNSRSTAGSSPPSARFVFGAPGLLPSVLLRETHSATAPPCSCGLFPSCMPNQRTPNVKDLSLTRKRPRLWQVHLCFPVQEGFETPLVHLQEEEPPSHLTPWPTALQNADLPRSGASSATRTVLVHVCSDGSTLAM